MLAIRQQSAYGLVGMGSWVPSSPRVSPGHARPMLRSWTRPVAHGREISCLVICEDHAGRGQGHRRAGSPMMVRVTGGVGKSICSRRGLSRPPGGHSMLLADPTSPSPARWSNVGVPRAASGRGVSVDGWRPKLCKTPPEPGPPTRWEAWHGRLGEPARNQALRRVCGERVLDAHCSRKVRGILHAIASPVRWAEWQKLVRRSATRSP